MNKTELNKYNRMLETKLAELSVVLRNRGNITVQNTPDPMDEVQLAGARELAICNLDRDSELLRNVKAALGRILDNDYGICLHCEQEIPPNRLNAVPWAKFCIKCHDLASAPARQNDDEDHSNETLITLPPPTLPPPKKKQKRFRRQTKVSTTRREMPADPLGSIWDRIVNAQKRVGGFEAIPRGPNDPHPQG